MMNNGIRFRNKLLALGITECLMVFPAVTFLVVATLRGLQPPQYEPARTSWIIFNWMATHLTRTDAALMFLVLPALAFAIGCKTLLENWNEDEILRRDVMALVASVRLNIHIVVLTAGTLAGAAVLIFAVTHMFTD